MTGVGRAPAVLAAALVVVALGVAGAARAGDGDDERRVVALDRSSGAQVAAAPLPADGRFALAYRHSVLRAPAEERFRATAGGAFVLEAIVSPSAGVLDYYELEGARSRSRGVWTLRLARPARFDDLALAATRVGRRTLVAGAQRIPLFPRNRAAAHLRVAVQEG